MDATSLMYLNGCTVDYVETLEAAGFKFDNPQVKSTCGCGSSFSRIKGRDSGWHFARLTHTKGPSLQGNGPFVLQIAGLERVFRSPDYCVGVVDGGVAVGALPPGLFPPNVPEEPLLGPIPLDILAADCPPGPELPPTIIWSAMGS